MSSLGDFLFAVTEWLRTTALVDVSLWLSDTPISIFVRDHFYIIPVFQTLHILSIAAAFGSAMMVNGHILRLVHFYGALPGTIDRFMPWLWSGLAMLILSGIGLVISDPPRELLNAVFWIKMIFVSGIILLSAAVQLRAIHKVDAAVRLGAVVVSLLWCAAMIAGRWIYYVPV